MSKEKEPVSQAKRDMSAALAARRKQAQARAKIIAEHVKEVLANEHVDPEFKRKLQYCQDEIDRGRTGFPEVRRAELLREAERRFRLRLDNPK